MWVEIPTWILMYCPTLVTQIHKHLRLHNKAVAHEITNIILDNLVQLNCSGLKEEQRIIAKVLTRWANDTLRETTSDKYSWITYKNQAITVLGYVKPIDNIELWIDRIIRHYIPFAALIYELR